MSIQHVITNTGREVRARLNVYRFTDKTKNHDPMVEPIRNVRFRNEAGSDKVYLTATDRYRLVEAVMTLSEATQEGFEFFIHHLDLARLAKAVKMSNRWFAFVWDGETVVFETDSDVIEVNGTIDGRSFPAVDRLWPDASELSEVGVDESNRGILTLNAKFLEDYKTLNETAKAGGKDVVTVVTARGKNQSFVVLGDGPWRGLMMPIQVYGGSLETSVKKYGSWDVER